jgi:uncharacterized small protein (DUF1192 family)
LQWRSFLARRKLPSRLLRTALAEDKDMDMEDDRPKAKPSVSIGEKLDSVSLDELQLRIQLLEVEIARVRAEIGRKQASKTAADAFFKPAG